MKAKPIMLCLLFILFFAVCSAQESFEIILRANTSTSEGFDSAFEDENNNFIAVGTQNTEYGADSFSLYVVKFDKFGNILHEKVIKKTDTTGVFTYGFQKANGNYFFMGTLSDMVTPKDLNISYHCELDEQLNMVWEKMYIIPEPYNSIKIMNYLVSPDGLIIEQGRADSTLYSLDDFLYLSLTDMQGNVLQFEVFSTWKDLTGSGELLFSADSSSFYLIGSLSENSLVREWVLFDNILNLLEYGFVENDLSYFYTPLSVSRLPDGNLFAANKSYGIGNQSYKDLEVRVFDSEFNLLKDTIIFYDKGVYLPVKNGLDYTDPNNIWVCVFEGVPPSFPGTETFSLHIFDAAMHHKGVREYGGENRFWLFHLFATSDGGCLITGTVNDFEGSHNTDAYIIKVMPEDVLTSNNELAGQHLSTGSAYPNPFSEVLKIKPGNENMQFLLYNATGKLLTTQAISPNTERIVSTSHLHPGFYFYQIKKENLVKESGKLLKIK
jgi:hypothetical protein